MARHVTRAGGLPEYGPPPTTSAGSVDGPGATPTTRANRPHTHGYAGSPLRHDGAMSTHHTQHSRPFTLEDASAEGEAARPDAFPWVHFLPEADVNAFTVELADTMRAADSVGDSAPVAQMLIAWQHTAEAHSDRELLAALTRDHGEDYGPTPDPRGNT